MGIRDALRSIRQAVRGAPADADSADHPVQNRHTAASTAAVAEWIATSEDCHSGREPLGDHDGPDEGHLDPPSLAQAKAEELQAEYFRQMTLENTPLGFYDDRYDMDDFPEEVDPASSDLAERALLQHLREHPELRENPAWADWYQGADETAGDGPPADDAAGTPGAPGCAPPSGGADRDHAQTEAAMAAVRADPSVLNLISARLAVDELPGDQTALQHELDGVERTHAEALPPLSDEERREIEEVEAAEAAGLFSDKAMWSGAVQEDPDETAAAVYAACAAAEQVDDAAAPPPHNSESRESAADHASVDD